MRIRTRLVPAGLVAVLGMSFPPGSACDGARAAAAGVDSERSTALSVSAGGAWTAVHILGGVHDAGHRTAILEAELIRTLKLGETLAIDWRFGFVPLETQATRLSTSVFTPGVGGRLERTTVYGGGLDPLGFGFRFRRGDWRPFARVSGGIRYFQSPVPDPRASRFNFAATLGLGVLRRVGRATWISLSADLHHVSNGGLADYNPGVNQLVLNVGCATLR